MLYFRDAHYPLETAIYEQAGLLQIVSFFSSQFLVVHFLLIAIMQLLVTLPVLTLLSQAHAQGLDFGIVYNAQPSLRHAKPNPVSSFNRMSAASSIVTRLSSEHAASVSHHATSPKMVPKKHKPTSTAHKTLTKQKGKPKSSTMRPHRAVKA